jgi:hypothetical protein
MIKIIRTRFFAHVSRALPALIVALAVAVPSFVADTAEAAVKNRRAVAIVIGNSKYQGSTPAVDFAHNDADAFRKYIVDVLGYDPENIIDLRDATKAQMETAFGNERSHEGKLWRYLDPKGRSDVVVFYSGHGVPGLKDRRGYLLPVDADANAPEINGFPLDVLVSNLGKLKTKSLSVFLDACFSGDSQKGMLINSTSGITIVPDLPANTSSMTMITAAQGDQVASWDLKAKHGMFTRHLLDALYGEADGTDYGNSDGQIALDEVREYLDDKMTRAARRQFGRHQNAWITGEDSQLLVSEIPRGNRPVTVAAVVQSKPKPKPVVKKQVVQPRRVTKPAPIVRPKPVAPSFDVAGLARRSVWRVEVEYEETWGGSFSGEVTVENGQISETFYNGALILNLWGTLWRGELKLEGEIGDRERFVHAPWGPAVEMVPMQFDTLTRITGPSLNINTTARADFTGDEDKVNIRVRLLRKL